MELLNGRPADVSGRLPREVRTCVLMNDRDHVVQLLIDEDVPKDEYLGCHSCVNTSSLKMRTDDVIKKFLPAVGHDFKMVFGRGIDRNE